MATDSIELFPGFPLPLSDYAPLLRELVDRRRQHSLRIAHSLGSLRALAADSDVPTALLAPSTPGRYVRRSMLAVGLAAAVHAPGRGRLAARLREETYRRYGAVAPQGVPLTLAEAVERLAPLRTGPLPRLTRVIVVCSDEDPRQPAQLELARKLGAAVHRIDGSHLFPIVQPAKTAEIIVEAFR